VWARPNAVSRNRFAKGAVWPKKKKNAFPYARKNRKKLHQNHGKSFPTICNSSISLAESPVCHTYPGKRSCICKSSSTHWPQILQWIYLPQNGSKESGSLTFWQSDSLAVWQSSCLHCILLGVGVKRFTWDNSVLINECRQALAYLPVE